MTTKIIHRPQELTILASVLLFSFPLIVLNFWVLEKGSLVAIFKPDHITWFVTQSIWVFSSMALILKARWEGFWSVCSLSFIIVYANGFFLSRTKNYALAFYGLFFFILSIFYLIRLFQNLRNPYYHSGSRWFEGYPLFLPQLTAELRDQDKIRSVRISKLAPQGCFAYLWGQQVNTDKSESLDQFSELVLRCGNLNLRCSIELVTLGKEGKGAGYRFVSNSLDQEKDIKDFIDRVRSLGYVE